MPHPFLEIVYGDLEKLSKKLIIFSFYHKGFVRKYYRVNRKLTPNVFT